MLVGTPDHWHALTMIAAVEAGADVYCQKPISVDVVEGQAMVAAARKHGRVVQVGTQRRSTPHLIEAQRPRHQGGQARQDRPRRDLLLLPHAGQRQPAGHDAAGPSRLRDVDRPRAPHAAVRRACVPHRRWWRTFTEYGNGIVGDMCIHMLDMVRWMLDLGWPSRISSTGGIYVQKDGKSNISDTQTATLRVPRVQRRLAAPHLGRRRPIPNTRGPRTIYGDKGTLKASVHELRLLSRRHRASRRSAARRSRKTGIPEDKTEKDMEQHAAMANRWHQKDFLKAIESRGKPVADIEQGYISTASCILANHSMKLGRSLTWDAEKQQVVGDDEANKLLRRPYRSPWKHPEVS